MINLKNILNYYITPWKKCVIIKGRADRPEFWYFLLISIIIFYILWAIDIATNQYCTIINMGTLSLVFFILSLCPLLTLLTRRLHDIGRSGYWVLGGLIIPALLLIGIPLIFLDVASSDGLAFLLIVLSEVCLILIPVAWVLLLIFACLPTKKDAD